MIRDTNNNDYNKNYDYLDEVEKTKKLNQEVKIDFFKENRRKPLLNKFTFEKDKDILVRYATPFIQFFESQPMPSLPMFTYPPEAKCVKRLTLDSTINIEPGNELYFQIFPFSKRMALYQNSSAKLNFLIDDKALQCFVKYKVVCCKIMVKQVGIMSLNDGYGTVMDAVVVPASTTFEFLKNNLLSVQTGPGRKVMMIDGRTGFECSLMGSPEYKEQYINEKTLRPDFVVVSSPLSTVTACNIPCNSRGTLYYGQNFQIVDTETNPRALEPYNIYNFHENYIAASGSGCLGVEAPQGDSLFVRVSQPTVNVSIKIYVDIVVEGQVRDEYALNMPQVIPTLPFDFNRIYFASQNVFPALRALPAISYCCTKRLYLTLSDKQKIEDTKELKSSYAKKKFYNDKVFNIKIRKGMYPKLKKEDIFEKRLQSLFFNLYSRSGHRAVSRRGYSVPQEGSFKKIFQKTNVTEYEIDRRKADPSWENMYKPVITTPEECISYAMMKQNPKLGGKIKVVTKVKRINNLIINSDIPKYIQNAIDFSGVLVSDKKATPKSNRIYMDSTQPLPSVSYQYFPAITNQEEVYPALVVVKLGQFLNDKITYDVSPPGEEGTKKLSVCYDKSQFTNPDEFLAALNDIINLLYGLNYHYAPDEGFSVSFYGKGKFADKSYMLALLAALYGGPSGGLYTGSFTLSDKMEVTIDKIEDEVLTTKLRIASQETPLIALVPKEDSSLINIISGSIPSYNEGKLLPVNSVEKACLYSLTPFSIRGYIKTPLADKNGDCKNYIVSKMSTDLVKYILYSNCHSLQAFENYSKGDVNYHTFSRANPDNFTSYIVRGKKIILASDYYFQHPENLQQGKKFWSFSVNNMLFVEKNLFSGDVKRDKATSKVGATSGAISKQIAAEKKALEITKDQLDELMNQVYEKLTNNDQGQNRIEMKELKEARAFRELSGNEKEKFIELSNQFKGVINSLDELLRDHPATSQDSIKVTGNNDILSVLGSLGLPTKKSSTLELKDNKIWKAFCKYYDTIGHGGIIGLAGILGLVDANGELTTSLKRKIFNGLKQIGDLKIGNLKLEKINEKIEEQKDEIVKEKEKKRKKAKSVGKKRISTRKKKKDEEDEYSDSEEIKKEVDVFMEESEESD